jgi:flavin-dependent dehydrogenase
MRAARAAMLGPAGGAKLGLANDDVKTKVVIDADGVAKRFGERAIIRTSPSASRAATGSAWSAPMVPARPPCSSC